MDKLRGLFLQDINQIINATYQHLEVYSGTGWHICEWPFLAASHRASTNRERTRHPSPFSLSMTTRGGRFTRECLRGRFGREILARYAPSRPGCCCCDSVPPSVLRRSWPHGARWMASGEDGGIAVVEGGVVAWMEWLLASWSKWSDRWRRGVNGVFVEMLVVAMFVVVLCTKITIVKEKRLTEDRSPSNHT